jgi:hypothetical protein
LKSVDRQRRLVPVVVRQAPCRRGELFTFPVVVGQGTRLFAAVGPDAALEVVGSRVTSSGVAIQAYRPNARPRYAGSESSAGT